MVEWASGQIAEHLALQRDIRDFLKELVNAERTKQNKPGANISVQQSVLDVRKKRGRPRKS